MRRMDGRSSGACVEERPRLEPCIGTQVLTAHARAVAAQQATEGARTGGKGGSSRPQAVWTGRARGTLPCRRGSDQWAGCFEPDPMNSIIFLFKFPNEFDFDLIKRRSFPTRKFSNKICIFRELNKEQLSLLKLFKIPYRI
jgi:hypothetical protein